MVVQTAIENKQPVINRYALRQPLIGVLAIAGGALVALGALLPWFSLLAGVQSYSGLVGMNGWLLIAGGVISAGAGLMFLFRGDARLRWGIGLFGFVLLAWSGWLLIQLLQTYRTLAADPLMVAQLGPGLFVAIAGAALVFGTLFVNVAESVER